MVNYLFQLILIISSFFLSYKINLYLKNFDEPGKNKIHKIKILSSGGIVPMFFLVLGIFYYIYFSKIEFSTYFYNIPQIWMAPTSILVFSLISFYDDLNFIPYQVRLFIQISIVYLCISLFPINPEFNFQTPIFQGMIPLKIDIVLTVIFWVFIINSTNFIDGYDGMFSFQIATTFFTFAFIFFIIDEMFHFKVCSAIFLIGILFIPFNLGKKFKMYIGDAGSIPSGFVLGWMTISLINMGYFLSGILINILFLLDVVITLLKRIYNKKSIFIRHNDFIFKKNILKHGAKKYFYFAFPLQIIICSISIYLVI